MDAAIKENAGQETMDNQDEIHCTGDLSLYANPGLRFRRIGRCDTGRRAFWVYGVRR